LFFYGIWGLKFTNSVNITLFALKFYEWLILTGEGFEFNFFWLRKLSVGVKQSSFYTLILIRFYKFFSKSIHLGYSQVVNSFEEVFTLS